MAARTVSPRDLTDDQALCGSSDAPRSDVAYGVLHERHLLDARMTDARPEHYEEVMSTYAPQRRHRHRVYKIRSCAAACPPRSVRSSE